MKKSLLNISLTIALSGAAFTSTLWSGQALSSEAGAPETLDISNHNSKPESTEDYKYRDMGMGAGAATGALLAGPVGLLAGGIIGAFVGSSQTDPQTDISEYTIENDQDHKTAFSSISEVDDPENAGPQIAGPETADPETADSDPGNLQIAQIGAITDLPQSDIGLQENNILDILTEDLSLDVFFRTGSSSIESFYPARLAAIARLMDSMTQLELHLDGYADRRGDKSLNRALANQRIQAVRQQLLNAGADENRIISKAFGEMKMVSDAGDLEAYTFDRKVVIRFQRSTADSISTMTSTLSALPAQNTVTEAAVNDTRYGETEDDSAASVVSDADIRF